MAKYAAASGSSAEDLFIDLFAEAFGAEKAGYLYSQYPFFDIYQNARFADFLLENGAKKIAIEVDDETSCVRSIRYLVDRRKAKDHARFDCNKSTKWTTLCKYAFIWKRQ